MADGEPIPTRERLVDAVLALYADGGSGAVSIAAVREHAAVSVGAVYHHFADRQALLDAAWLRCLESHQQSLLQALAATTTAPAGVRAVVHAYLAWHVEHPAGAAMLRESGPPRERAEAWAQRRALNRPLFATLGAWWERHEQAGELRPLSPALIHALWFGAARDLCDLWLTDPRVGSPVEHAEVLGDAAWRAVAAD